MVGIYKITNLINNKCYIGQSTNIYNRFSQHRSASRCEKDLAYNFNIHQAMRKYGIENFIFEIIEECSKEELIQKEVYWINYYDSFKNGYNMNPGGFGGFKSQEHRDKCCAILQQQNEKQKAENHPKAKISNEEVLLIRKRYINGESIQEIFQDYKNEYTLNGFRHIVLGMSYQSLERIKKEDIRHTNAKLTKNQVLEIREKYAKNNLSQKELGEYYGISQTAIGRIVRKETYKHIK